MPRVSKKENNINKNKQETKLRPTEDFALKTSSIKRIFNSAFKRIFGREDSKISLLCYANSY